MASTQYWSELEQEPFDPEEFVERLAWRTVGSASAKSDTFDATRLNDAFVQAIKDLTVMHEKQKKKCELLEQKCREEEQIHWKKVSGLIERNKAAATTFKSLDGKINSVATKVVHLGDQLESVNTPRARDVQALKLMRHFDDFVGGEMSLSPIFHDRQRLNEAADIILKLHLISQELPPEKFDAAKHRIETKYTEIEQALTEEFVKSHRSSDMQRMKEYALILSRFRNYNRCVDEFIDLIQSQQFRSKDIFKDIVPLCEKSWKVIGQVFPNPQQVMSKFILNVYHHKLKEHIAMRLADKNKTELYLSNLFQLYSQTVKLTTELSHFNLGTDPLFLSNLTKTIFTGYLTSYINIESRFLNDECSKTLNRYYISKGHQKKQISAGAAQLQDMKRDLQGFISSKANITFDHVSYGGETFLSEEVAINLLQQTKMAFRRCQVLSNQKDLPSNAVEIFGLLVHYLLFEHVTYALKIGDQGIPPPESKSPPEIYFFDVICQTNAIIHLLEKQFNDSLVPLVVSTTKHSECVQKKKNELEKLELLVTSGLDKTINAIVGWVRTILRTEQKTTDFNPPSHQAALALTSPACMKVIKFINYQVEKIRDSLDGKNIEYVLMELGVRLHRVVYDHLHQFTYNSTGALSAICDVQEYRKCVAEFKVGKVNTLFDTLHALCNLLMFPPENLRGAAQGDQLASIDRTILDNWIQLRTDYKTERLGNYL